ncbi:MAG: Acryloyl-CoA reductase electron transfer subunit gamma [Syntrophorhabdaceae bacterium PtaU1.Bin034]|nr:MAG: Acryloyl-CoA reductase electron transfer subunit gamma [Syntrophorhabdaceae bacterium PtaU1.Bin034]
MKILVFIKEVPDVRIPVEYEEAAGRIRRAWGVTILNPPDRTALNTALKIKADVPGSHLTVIHLGSPSEERFIRESLAAGCDDGLRIWEEGLDSLQSQAKSLIFARVAEILGFDLILAGTRSQDTGHGQIGALVASRLRVPCISSVTELEIRVKERSIIATKRLSHGYHERLESPLPLVIAMEALSDPGAYASLPALLEATEREIPCIDLAEIGISRAMLQQADSRLVFGPPGFPKSRLRSIEAPDSSLPAFERIRSLVAGTIKRREGKIVRGEEDQVADELFRTLLKGGWLSHLRKGG